MHEVKDAKQLYESFPVPCFFRTKTDVYDKIKIDIANLTDVTTYSETATVTKPDKDFSFLTFQQLGRFVDELAAQRIQSTLKKALQAASLYNDSLYRITMTFSGSKGQTQIQEHFICHGLVKQSKTVTTQMSVNMNFCDASATITNGNPVAVETIVVANNTFSDTVLYTTKYTNQPKYIKQHIDIGNQEATEILFFVIGQFMDSKKQLIAHDSISFQPIIVPKTSITKGDVKTDNGRKQLSYGLRIEAPVWNGVEYTDKGSLFYKNGLQLSIDGETNVNILVNKQLKVE